MSALFETQEAQTQANALAYRVLARKYRPQRFEDLIGQEAMVRTLSNAIQAGRLPQAWMLTGVRGIGKTTTARIIARALNCIGPDGKGGATITPCGVCEACTAISEDRHVDIQELDAASRTSVDDIREIIDGVRYGPVSARYKIYILDEVHMLSKNAFNALLKTLEEPPPHTKFIFATTEIRKVPITVLSRCQRFDLRRIETNELAKHFGKIAGLENAEAEPEALQLIAQAADGSVRDGLSLLDQAIARGNGSISTEDVKDMLGMADRAHCMALCRVLLKGETKDALKTFSSIMQTGTDPLQVLQDLCEMVHLLTRGQIIPDLSESLDIPEAERDLLRDLSSLKIPALTRSWQILLKGIQEVQTALNPAQTAEMVLIRLAYAANLPPPSDLVKQIQEQMSSGKAFPSSGGGSPAGTGGSRAQGTGFQQHYMTQSNTAQAISAAPNQAPHIQASTALAPTTSLSLLSFREIAGLFAENREAGLYSQLYSFAHAVRCEEGFLELCIKQGASDNLANRVAQCLTLWTGRRWMVSLTNQEGAPTLADQDKVIEQERMLKAKNHPLTQAVLLAFPDAKLLSLLQKRVATETLPQDDEIITFDSPYETWDDSEMSFDL